ncbi:hypothetical protein EK904_000757 [Melospiza melodia maxima]|nr:hypothetical protein EK904_000757 [Melospiza melodia maxima]
MQNEEGFLQEGMVNNTGAPVDPENEAYEMPPEQRKIPLMISDNFQALLLVSEANDRKYPWLYNPSRDWHLQEPATMPRLEQRRQAERMVVKLSKHYRNAEGKRSFEEPGATLLPEIRICQLSQG